MAPQKSCFSLGTSRKNSAVGRSWFLLLQPPNLSRIIVQQALSSLQCDFLLHRFQEDLRRHWSLISGVCVSWLEHIFFTNVNSSQKRREKESEQLGVQRQVWPRACIIHFQCQMETLRFFSHLQITSQNQAQKTTTANMPFSPFQVNTESCSCQSSDESWLPSIQRALSFFHLQTFNLLAELTEKL